ncbi:EspF repeat-containing protein [Escherichia coli]
MESKETNHTHEVIFMMNKISYFLSTIPRSITSISRNSNFSVSPQKVSLTPIRIHSPLYPSNSQVSAVNLFTIKNAPLSSSPKPFNQAPMEITSVHRTLPDVAQRLLSELAEHGIKPERDTVESSLLTPRRPAPPPPVSGDGNKSLPDVAQRLLSELAEHGIKPDQVAGRT